jgi:ankyrin repeat protein
MVASERGHLEVVRKLIDGGADVNKIDDKVQPM